MKVVTATSQTQGWRDNDFCWTVEGELLFFAPFEVAVARPPIDGDNRSYQGARTRTHTQAAHSRLAHTSPAHTRPRTQVAHTRPSHPSRAHLEA